VTLPCEEKWAIEQARLFLLDLGHGKYKRVPYSVRAMAMGILRHYPGPVRLEKIYKRLDISDLKK
jgi:hypothetical protein